LVEYDYGPFGSATKFIYNKNKLSSAPNNGKARQPAGTTKSLEGDLAMINTPKGSASRPKPTKVINLRRKLITVMVALGIGPVIAVGVATSVAQATSGDPNQVTFCHRDNNEKQPYGPKAITTDYASVFKQGHDGHTGPIFEPGMKAAGIKWGDIIPPFDYVDKQGVTQHFAGLNWTAEGEAFVARDCQLPTSTTTTPPPTTTTTTTPPPTTTTTTTPPPAKTVQVAPPVIAYKATCEPSGDSNPGRVDWPLEAHVTHHVTFADGSTIVMDFGSISMQGGQTLKFTDVADSGYTLTGYPENGWSLTMPFDTSNGLCTTVPPTTVPPTTVPPTTVPPTTVPPTTHTTTPPKAKPSTTPPTTTKPGKTPGLIDSDGGRPSINVVGPLNQGPNVWLWGLLGLLGGLVLRWVYKLIPARRRGRH